MERDCCFGRNWKIPGEEDISFDIDSMPRGQNIREMLKMLDAQSLNLLVDKMKVGKAKRRTLTPKGFAVILAQLYS